MDLRSRRYGRHQPPRPMVSRARHLRLAAWPIGIVVALAACGQAATTSVDEGNQHALRSVPFVPDRPSSSGERGRSTPGSPGTTPESGGSNRLSGDTTTASPGATATPSGPTASATEAPTPLPTLKPTPLGTRNKFLWPFTSTSIWNMPIGRAAVYVSVHIAAPTIQTLTSDQDIIVMDPTAPLMSLQHSGAGWGGGNRCSASGPALASVPIPADFLVPSDRHNDALAVVMPDGQTVVQGQPFARCAAAAIGTVLALAPSDNLYGAGILGAHGGSGLSSLGGTIRLNELVPGGQIRHALKVNLDAAADLYPSPGFRWPAIRHNSCAPGCYGGSVPALEMGSLLAIPTSVDINALGLETAPGRMLAWTLQNYGAYVADNTARSVFSIETEDGPSGRW